MQTFTNVAREKLKEEYDYGFLHNYSTFQIKKKDSDNYIKIIIFHLVPFPAVVFNIDNEQFVFYYDQKKDEKIYKDAYCVNHLFDIIPIFSSNEKEDANGACHNIQDIIVRDNFQKLVVENRKLIQENTCSYYKYMSSTIEIVKLLYAQPIKAPNTIFLNDDNDLQFDWFDEEGGILLSIIPCGKLEYNCRFYKGDFIESRYDMGDLRSVFRNSVLSFLKI